MGTSLVAVIGAMSILLACQPDGAKMPPAPMTTSEALEIVREGFIAVGRQRDYDRLRNESDVSYNLCDTAMLVFFTPKDFDGF